MRHVSPCMHGWVSAAGAVVGTWVEWVHELPRASCSWVQPPLKPVWVTIVHHRCCCAPQHPGSDIFQEDQQQLQAGDGQGTLLGRQMAGETAAEMQSWRCTLRRMSFMSKGDILWPVSDLHWARMSLRNCGCGWPAPGQQQSWGIVVMGDQCWRRNHPEGLWSPGKPVRSTKEWGKPIRMSDEQRNPSKKHGRAADQKHYIPSLSLQSCSL